VVGNLSDVRVRGGGREVHVSARPFSGTIRGLNRDGRRPTLVVLDDVEKPEHLDSPTTRQRMRARLSDDIGNLGPPEGGLACIYGATDLGEGSLPSHAATELGWERSTVPAVLAWPEGLAEGVDAPGSRWEACRRLYLDRTDPQRRQTARRFYDDHRGEMVRGARVLHPVYQPLWSLVERLWDSGRVGFFRDYQQRPLSGDAQVFALAHIRRAHLIEDAEERPTAVRLHDGDALELRDCDVALWLDPRNSHQPDRNDYSGLGVVAVHRRTGRAAILEHVAVREAPAASVARLWALWARYRHLDPIVGAEANQGGALVLDEWARLRERRPSGSSPSPRRCRWRTPPGRRHPGWHRSPCRWRRGSCRSATWTGACCRASSRGSGCGRSSPASRAPACTTMASMPSSAPMPWRASGPSAGWTWLCCGGWPTGFDVLARVVGGVQKVCGKG
jgi:hypothetical protein